MSISCELCYRPNCAQKGDPICAACLSGPTRALVRKCRTCKSPLSESRYFKCEECDLPRYRPSESEFETFMDPKDSSEGIEALSNVYGGDVVIYGAYCE